MLKKPAATKTLFIRNFPSDIYRLLKSRAALQGTTIGDYLAAQLRVSFSKEKLDKAS